MRVAKDKARANKDDKNIAIVTVEDLRRIREETEKKPTRTSDIVNNTEIERMKASTKIQTKDEKAETKKVHDEQV